MMMKGSVVYWLLKRLGVLRKGVEQDVKDHNEEQVWHDGQ